MVLHNHGQHESGRFQITDGISFCSPEQVILGSEMWNAPNVLCVLTETTTRWILRSRSEIAPPFHSKFRCANAWIVPRVLHEIIGYCLTRNQTCINDNISIERCAREASSRGGCDRAYVFIVDARLQSSLLNNCLVSLGKNSEGEWPLSDHRGGGIQNCFDVVHVSIVSPIISGVKIVYGNGCISVGCLQHARRVKKSWKWTTGRA